MKYFIFLFGLFCITPASSIAAVFISEIAVNTSETSTGGSENNKKEWIELYNNESVEKDISGWKVEYTLTGSGAVYFYTLPSFTSIPSGKNFVLVNNKDEFNHEFSGLFSGSFLGIEMSSSAQSNCNQSTRCFRLSNTQAGELRLFDATGIEQDLISWDEIFFKNDKGTSACRLKDLSLVNRFTPMNPGERCDVNDIISTPLPTTVPTAIPTAIPTAVPTPTPTPTFVSIPTPIISEIVISSENNTSSSSAQTSSNSRGGGNAIVLEELRSTGTASQKTESAGGLNSVVQTGLGEDSIPETREGVYEGTNLATCAVKQFFRYPQKRENSTLSHIYGLNAYEDLKQQEVVSGESLLSNNISRAEFSKIMTITRQDVLPCEWNASFSDVLEDEWFFDFVKNMQTQNIVHGYSDGYFYPHKSISLAESYKMFAIGFRYISKEQADEMIFGSQQKWFEPYKNVLMQHNLLDESILSYSDDVFITRAQAFVILSEILQRVDNNQF